MGRRDALLLIGVALAGLAVRLAFFGAYRLEGMDCDGAGYLEVARHFVRGHGFVTDAHRFLFLPAAPFPQPDAHWSPLYPVLTALSFALFGETFTAAKLVPLAFGVAVPPLTWAFTRALTDSRRAAFAAAALAIVHPTLVTWSLRIETEIATVAFALAAWTLALASRSRAGALGLGAVLGLAWLMKYQAALLVPPVLLALFLRMPAREALRHALLAGAAFAIAVSPWLVRNALVFGDPLYTDLRFNVLSYYARFGGEPRFLSSLARPPDAMAWLAAHPGEVLAHVRGSIHYLRLELAEARVAGPLLLGFVAVGVVPLARHWRRSLPLLLYALLLGLVFTVTVPQARYLFSWIPIGLAAAGAGAAWLFARAGQARAQVLVGLAVIGIGIVEVRDTLALVRDRKAEWNPAAAFCPLEAEATRGWIAAHLGARSPVLATEVYHAAYVYGRPVIQVPFDDSTLAVVSERFGAQTMVVSDRELARRLPHWATAPPAWAHLVGTIPADSVRARTGVRWYGPVSDVRIFRLDPARRAGATRAGGADGAAGAAGD